MTFYPTLLPSLIIQRLNLAQWGFFTEFQGLQIRAKEESTRERIFEATFEGEGTIYIYPFDDPIYGGINLLGRSTAAAGVRRKTDGDWDTPISTQIREGNDLIVKFSWPRSRESKVKFIEEAREIGESNDLVKNHIPTMVDNSDPPYVTCSTRPIRQFLGLKAEGERVLRVIAFHRLREIKFLDEEDMMIAFLDCFFCKSLSKSLHHLMILILR